MKCNAINSAIVVAAAILGGLLVWLVFEFILNKTFSQQLEDNFGNHQLIQFIPKDELDLNKLDLLRKNVSIKLWTESLKPSLPALFELKPEELENFLTQIETYKLPFTLITSNLNNLLQNQTSSPSNLKLNQTDQFNLNQFNHLEDIESYLKLLEKEHPKQVKLEVYGHSIEKRELLCVHIAQNLHDLDSLINNLNNTPNESNLGEMPLLENLDKKIVVFECGINAREWLSPAVCLQFIDKLINDQESQSLLNDYEFYIMPLINPDGYLFTWTKDRLWKKNRRRLSDKCYGVDLDSNFPINFNAKPFENLTLDLNINLMNETSSEDLNRNKKETKQDLNTAKKNYFLSLNESNQMDWMCDDLYPNQSPLTEPETYFFNRFLVELQNKVNLYFAIHASSNIWIYPNLELDNLQKQDQIKQYAKLGVETLNSKFDLDYKYGQADEFLFSLNGLTIDWASKELEIDLVYSIGKQDQDLKKSLTHDNEIEPTVTKLWSALSEVLKSYSKNVQKQKPNEKEENSSQDHQIGLDHARLRRVHQFLDKVKHR